jgi:glycosyltransferase involved in cell wall biosynthesis
MRKLTVLIPCHNEERGISKVIHTIPLRLLKKLDILTEIIVIDNNSTDRTVENALAANATVIRETKKGKGNAILTGFNSVQSGTHFVVMLDGDNTYKSKEIVRMIEPLMNNFCDVVVGSRLSGKIKKNSLKYQNRIANWIYTFAVRQFYQANVTDVLSGYFAWKKEVLDELRPHLESKGFEIEMEMITKMKRLGFEMFSVPITYDEREGETKIDSIRDGIKILTMFAKNLNWSPTTKKRAQVTFKINHIKNSYEAKTT